MAAANKTSGMLKVNQLTKDLGIKSKDMSEIMTAEGVENKSQKILTPTEFSIIFDRITRDNQIKGIEDYLDGVTVIPSKAKTEKAEPAPEAQKSDVAPVEVKEQAKVESVNPEPAKSEPAKSEPAKSEPAKSEPVRIESAKSEPVKEKIDAAPAKKAEPQKPVAEYIKKASEAPKKNIEPKNEIAKPVQQRNDRPAPRTDRPAQYQQNQQGGQKPQGARPNFNQGNDRQNGFQPRNDRPYAQNDRNGQGKPQQRGGNGFQQGRQGANNGFFDKDERQQSAPREKFKPQPIVRSQTMKGDETKQRGATRVVDMRGSSVDLSKYDEKLDNFVPDNVSNMRGGMQRVKKQGASNNFVANKGKDKNKNKKAPQSVTKAPTSVVLPAEIVVSDLASRLKVTSGEVVKRLMMLLSL